MGESSASLTLLFIGAILFTNGCNVEQRARENRAKAKAISPERREAETDLGTGHTMQVIGGGFAAVGVVVGLVALAHRRVQSQALKQRLVATYTFVPATPSDDASPDPGLLSEDQAVDHLRSGYPSMAPVAAETLRREFAEKRRLEPTKIWYVKDLRVVEAKG